MRTDDALGRLLDLLDAAGVDRDHPTRADVATTWATMREFARDRFDDAGAIEDDSDAFLAQYGAYGHDDEDGQRAFTLDITRQFMFEDASGDYAGMAQLHCTFVFASSEANRAVEPANLWSMDDGNYDSEMFDRFFAQALAMPGFLLDEEPTKLEIGYGPV